MEKENGMCTDFDPLRSYVIANNTIETASDSPGINDAILQGILPKLPVTVITLEQAIEALDRSGPAVAYA